MDLQTAVRTCLAKYVEFDGRARRSEFWYWSLAVFVGNLVIDVVDLAIGSPILGYVYVLALLVPGLAVLWRRLHDTGRSGTWFLISLVPIVGAIVLIVFACQDSQPGDNRYGPNPKGSAGADTWS